jgi:hypothetical protein
MTKKGLIWIIIAWVSITLINYYYTIYFILAIIWFVLIISLFYLMLVQLKKTFEERKNLSKLRITNLLTFSLLFILTLYRHKTNLVIEKIDWFLLENKRNEIVEQVKNKEINPNVSWNGWVCELQFEFPVISNGGNDIGILRNKKNNGTTVMFWVFRNFFDSPSTHFVYSNDPENIKSLDEKIANRPNENWKIKENWYRTYGE